MSYDHRHHLFPTMRQNESLDDEQVKNELNQLFGQSTTTTDEKTEEEEENDNHLLVNFWLLFAGTFFCGLVCIFLTLNINIFEIVLPEKTKPFYNLLSNHITVNKYQ